MRIRAGRAADIADIDDELAAWRAALPAMTPIEKLRLSTEIGEVRLSVEQSARLAAAGDIPAVAQQLCDRAQGLLDDIARDAGARGSRDGAAVARVVALTRAAVERLRHRLDFDGCLQRVEDLLLESVGARTISE
jgi:hypothetical protein